MLEFEVVTANRRVSTPVSVTNPLPTTAAVAGAAVSATNPLPTTGLVGCTASASFLPIAAVYSAGDIISVAQEFAFSYSNGVAIPAGSLIRILDTIVKIDATALISGEAAYTLQGYSATPPSAQADNAAWSLASADLTVYRGSIGLGTPVDLGAALYVKQSNIDVDIKLTGSSLFGELVTVAGFTAPAVARQVLIYAAVL